MPSETPSDPVLAAVAAALAPAAAPWREAVVATEEELRGLLATPATPAASATALGDFASGRIDFERFSGLVSRARTMEDTALARVRVAFETLSAAAAEGAGARVAPVPAGGRVRDAVEAALARIGRAFGAAHQAALARQSAFRPEEHATLHESFPFARWTRRERRLAPPVVLEVDGASFDAGDLVPYLDGTMKFALVVKGPCPPAVLVRLVTPNTFVMQTADPAAFARLAAAPGAGVGALVPDGAAHFVHDPAGGRAPWERVRIDRMPSDLPRRPLGLWSAEQQTEELRQLAALAVRPSEVAVQAAASKLTGAEAAAAAADPAGRLAAWLLRASEAGAA